MHVYFDHNATTPLDERVLEAMLPFLQERVRQRVQPPRVRHARAQGGESARASRSRHW